MSFSGNKGMYVPAHHPPPPPLALLTVPYYYSYSRTCTTYLVVGKRTTKNQPGKGEGKKERQNHANCRVRSARALLVLRTEFRYLCVEEGGSGGEETLGKKGLSYSPPPHLTDGVRTLWRQTVPFQNLPHLFFPPPKPVGARGENPRTIHSYYYS